ncbi:hypothetical protein INR49_005484, partial [Caranx melampygus]
LSVFGWIHVLQQLVDRLHHLRTQASRVLAKMLLNPLDPFDLQFLQLLKWRDTKTQITMFQRNTNREEVLPCWWSPSPQTTWTGFGCTDPRSASGRHLENTDKHMRGQ